MIVLEVLNAQPLPQVGRHCLETSTRAGIGTGHRQVGVQSVLLI